MIRYLVDSGDCSVSVGAVISSNAMDLKTRDQRVWIDGDITVNGAAVKSINGLAEPAGTSHTVKSIIAVYAYPAAPGGTSAGHAGGKCYALDVD